MWLAKNVVPTSEGWYWCKYYNKHKKIITVPCYVTLFKQTKQFVVSTAKNDFYSSNNQKQFGVIWISKERIPEPE